MAGGSEKAGRRKRGKDARARRDHSTRAVDTKEEKERKRFRSERSDLSRLEAAFILTNSKIKKV